MLELENEEFVEDPMCELVNDGFWASVEFVVLPFGVIVEYTAKIEVEVTVEVVSVE